MAGQYHVIFSGQIIEHADLDMVKHNVARAFKLPPEQVDKLFSGKRIVLKKNVDGAMAEKYRITLEHAGALCEVVSSDANVQASSAGQAGNAVTAPVPEPSVNTAVDSGMTLAEVGITLIEPTPIPEVNIDTSDMDMAEVGITLAEPKPIPEVNIDTSDMDMAEVGITLAEPRPLPEVTIDTSDMGMAEVGITLAEPKPIPEVTIDTSGMDMAEVGITLAEPKPIPEVNIDTSGIQLAEDQGKPSTTGRANFDV